MYKKTNTNSQNSGNNINNKEVQRVDIYSADNIATASFYSDQTRIITFQLSESS